MDLYNRWCFRASGEAKHQATTVGEQATYKLLALLEEYNLFDTTMDTMDEHKRNQFMVELADFVDNRVREQVDSAIAQQYGRPWLTRFLELF